MNPGSILNSSVYQTERRPLCTTQYIVATKRIARVHRQRLRFLFTFMRRERETEAASLRASTRRLRRQKTALSLEKLRMTVHE